MSQIDEQSPHRLFAAIVLMGTGLAVGCGGISEGERQVGAGGQPNVSHGGTNTGATASAGTGVATSTGGTSNIGNAPSIDIGGTTSEPEAVDPGPFKCPPEQWTCASTHCDYSAAGWALPDSCDCDPKRPRSPSDCGAGEVFVCQNATTTSDGRPFTKPVALSCSCVQKSMYFCSTECDAAFGPRDLMCRGSQDELSALCGCAVVYLK